MNDNTYINEEEAEIYTAIVTSDQFEIERTPPPDSALKQAEEILQRAGVFISETDRHPRAPA